MDRAKDSDTEISGILDELRQHYEVSGAGENRQHERKAWCVPLTVLFKEKVLEGVIERPAEVTTHDISRGGFSFVYDQYVHLGTKIHVRFDTLPSTPRVSGIVRNAIHLHGKRHRIGVKFAGIRREPTS